MDMRQKLLPIFLREAGKNLEMLQHFLQNQQHPICRYDDLEAAFRAAHTLKGTSLLVQANSVNSIARRIEALLEKHLSNRTSPTNVEFEAMQLAVEWLFQLVGALREDQPEPSGLVAEALRALDLAKCFPGTTPLVELLDSNSEQRSPRLDDPFASDPALDINEKIILSSAQDPFADDPGFGFELDIRGLGQGETGTVKDPFADDSHFDSDLLELKALETEHIDTAESLPFDPFAEDSSFLEGQLNGSGGDFLQTAQKMDLDQNQEIPLVSGEVKGTQISTVEESQEAGLVEDPFAEDPDLEEKTETVEEQLLEPDQPELLHLENVKEFAESLLLPKPDEDRREYSCCVFNLSGHSYYLPIKYMVEISEQPPLLQLPLAPTVVKGLINLRGQVMPVIDLSALHSNNAEIDQVRRLVVAEHLGEKVAFLAEGIPHLSEEFVGEKIDLPSFISHHRIRGG